TVPWVDRPSSHALEPPAIATTDGARALGRHRPADRCFEQAELRLSFSEGDRPVPRGVQVSPHRFGRTLDVAPLDRLHDRPVLRDGDTRLRGLALRPEEVQVAVR